METPEEPQGWDEGRWGNPYKYRPLNKGSFILPTFVPPVEAPLRVECLSFHSRVPEGIVFRHQN